MKTFKIKTHRKGRSYQKSHFYILNKGKNAGRPLRKAYCNSFVLFANNEAETEKLFWICRILHQGNYFKPYLTGTCMEFIHIGSVHKLLCESLKKFGGKNWEERFKILRQMDEFELNLKRQSEQIKSHKTLLLDSYGPQLE